MRECDTVIDDSARFDTFPRVFNIRNKKADEYNSRCYDNLLYRWESGGQRQLRGISAIKDQTGMWYIKAGLKLGHDRI